MWLFLWLKKSTAKKKASHISVSMARASKESRNNSEKADVVCPHELFNSARVAKASTRLSLHNILVFLFATLAYAHPSFLLHAVP